MKILLIAANIEQINMPSLPLGAACVAAATKAAGHETVLLDLLGRRAPLEDLRQAILDLQPEVIGISVRNIDDQQAAAPRLLLAPLKEVVAACRSLTRAPIVLGGAGYSIFPVEVLAYLGADFGLQGEGEHLLPALLDRLAGRRAFADLPGVVLPGCPVEKLSIWAELDSLPLPDARIWAAPSLNKEELWLPVQSRRGCPMGCSYCSTPVIEGRLTRNRSAEKVASWLAHWRDSGFSKFFFVDNTFNLPPRYARELCRQILKITGPASWRAIIYPKGVNEELAELMAESGCRQVSLGFESGSTLILKEMRKGFSPVDVRKTAEMLGRTGISRLGFLLLGGPGETRETVTESLHFADSLDLEAVKVTVGIRIYPQTRLAAIARDQGLIAPDDSLLQPRFYLVPELAEWLRATAAEWVAARPHWTGS